MSVIVKIPLENLEEGMIVVKFDKGGFTFPHYGHPFPDIELKDYLFQNGVRHAFIKKSVSTAQKKPDEQEKEESAPQRDKKLKEVDEVMDENVKNVAEEKVKSEAEEKVKNAVERQLCDIKELPSIEEMTKAVVLHRQAKAITSNILLDARMGKMIDTSSAKEVVNSLVDHCIKSPETFVSMTRLKDFDTYTFTHSVNVSVLAISIGKRLGCSMNEMSCLGLAGLLHDIGKMMIPEEIINKPDRLTEEEFELVKMHPEYGYEYLKKDYKMSLNKDLLAAVRYHHERSDGTGYPDGISEKEIPRFAKILSIADVYDAITTQRPYHKGMIPSDALKTIFNWSGKHFSDYLVKFFISIMGIYPVGTLVVLNTNELAVIFGPNKSDPTRPKALIISDSNMQPVQPWFFDLASYNVTTMLPYKSIVSSLDPTEFSIDTNQIIEQFLLSAV